jgi:hypothetical protein
LFAGVVEYLQSDQHHYRQKVAVIFLNPLKKNFLHLLEMPINQPPKR